MTDCPQCGSLRVREYTGSDTTSAYRPPRYCCLDCGCQWQLLPATSAASSPNYIIYRAPQSRGATSP